MRRRYWPVTLAVLAVLVLGSYLVFTRYVIREVKAQAGINSLIFSLVQRGLLGEEEDALTALYEIQGVLTAIRVPMVVMNAEGEPYGAANAPFVPDFATEQGRQRVREFAADLQRRNPANRAVVAGSGVVVFGDPAYVQWLRLVPWLQAAGGAVLLLLAFGLLQADVRAERERLWAAMARELAHQMGTPLSSLSGWMEVLALPDAERAALASTEHIARVIGADVERLERVSRRFELIGKPPVVEPVPVAAVLQELEAYFRPRLPRLGRGVRMRVRAAEGLPDIRANRVLLVWALENVVKNAVDALSGRGGRILVVAHGGADASRVHIHIADDGPGIAPGVRDRIFEPGVSTKSGGWGVGLSLTRRIVEQLHGGRVSARSRAGGGTVFDFVLPADGGRPSLRHWLRWKRDPIWTR
jgi:signal transduction histidine kinase